MYTVLIAEDESDIRQLISFNLERESMDTLLAKDGAEAFEIAKEKGPDLIILDLMLPKMDGFTVFKELRLDSRTKDIPVIMLTAKAQLDDVITGLNAGADDYICKPFSVQIFMARVHALLRRKATEVPHSQTLTTGPLKLSLNTYTATLDKLPLDLSISEFKLLDCLCKKPGWVFSRQQLIDHMRGENYIVTTRLVDVTLVSLRKKLGDFGNNIKTIRGIGYCIKQP